MEYHQKNLANCILFNVFFSMFRAKYLPTTLVAPVGTETTGKLSFRLKKRIARMGIIQRLLKEHLLLLNQETAIALTRLDLIKTRSFSRN